VLLPKREAVLPRHQDLTADLTPTIETESIVLRHGRLEPANPSAMALVMLFVAEGLTFGRGENLGRDLFWGLAVTCDKEDPIAVGLDEKLPVNTIPGDVPHVEAGYRGAGAAELDDPNAVQRCVDFELRW
jgi:hypothetical protein